MSEANETLGKVQRRTLAESEQHVRRLQRRIGVVASPRVPSLRSVTLDVRKTASPGIRLESMSTKTDSDL